MVVLNMSFSSALPFPSSSLTGSSNLYSRIPTSPTTSISSIESLSSRMSSEFDAESSRTAERERSYSTSASTSPATASSSLDSPSDEKRFHDVEALSDDDEHGSDYDYESQSLLGVIPIPTSLRLPKRWRSRLKQSLRSHSDTNSRSRLHRSASRKLRETPLIPVILTGLALLSLVGIGYRIINISWSPADLITSNEYETDLVAQAVPEWVKSVRTIENDTTHVLVPPHSRLNQVRLLQPLRDRLPYPVLEEYFSTGRLPSAYQGKGFPAIEEREEPHHGLAQYQPPLDLVFLFVNASSPYMERAMLDRAEMEGVMTKGKKRHWRDNGELRGAIRSGVKHLGNHAGDIHLVTADWRLREEDRYLLNPNASSSVGPSLDDTLQVEGEGGQGGWRVGQIPEWLDWESQTTETDGTQALSESPARRMRWHFHSDIFQLPLSDDGIVPTRNVSSLEPRGENLRIRNRTYLENGIERAVDVDVTVEWNNEEEWRNQALPSFNSFAIESRLGWVEGLSENFIAFNDDMFVLRDLSSADFRHPLLGNVIRMDSGLLVSPFVEPGQLSDPGEWGALNHANALLSRRFPEKKRMYMHHLPKTVSRAMVDEASIMFSEELSLATTRGFRESLRGDGDVEMAWLTTHLKIERWREAVLWSWAVAKVGGVEGVWGRQSRAELRDVLGMKAEEGDDKRKVLATRGPRKTLEDLEEINHRAGWEGPKASSYHFSSLDGHLPNEPDKEGFAENAQCVFQFSDCLPADFFSDSEATYSASDMFSHMAFAQPECGNCLITSLVRKSGERGLEAFLPAGDQTYHPPTVKHQQKTRTQWSWSRSEPMLPLVHDWREADFSLEANVRSGQDHWEGTPNKQEGDRSVDLRRWCIKLLSRYNYIYGGTPSLFAPIHSSTQILDTLDRIDAEPHLALFCMNDDQVDATTPRALRARRTFGEWMEARFGDDQVTVEWEKEGVQWYDHDLDMTAIEDRDDDEGNTTSSPTEGSETVSVVPKEAPKPRLEWVDVWETDDADASW